MVELRTYSGQKLRVLGKIVVNVSFNNSGAELELIVVSGDGPTLLGMDWLTVLEIDVSSCVQAVHSVRSSLSFQPVLDKHSALFSDELTLVKGVTVKLHVDKSVFLKPRPVPFTLSQRIEVELDRLEKAGIIESVRFSDWAAPIVPVVKNDGTVRICGDFKLTVNRTASIESYPLPRVSDLLASIGKGKISPSWIYQMLIIN